jgi:hypothetical protein
MSRQLLFAIVLLLTFATASHGQSSDTRWLRGSWEGVGYQMDTESTWPMKLVRKGNRYSVEYPSLNCSGRWRLLNASRNLVRFREEITVGRELCTDRGTVIIQRLSRRQIAYRYYIRGARDVTASAILNRK